MKKLSCILWTCTLSWNIYLFVNHIDRGLMWIQPIDIGAIALGCYMLRSVIKHKETQDDNGITPE